MAKKYMRRNSLYLSALILSGFILLNSACAQNPPFSGKAYVDEERLVMQSTFLLNNASFVIPLQNLDEQKIASVHFSNIYAAGFDSLLNKYARVDSFNGNDYNGVKTLANLSEDLKWYNTVIVQLNDADLANPQLIDFINSNQKLKTVIIALFGNGNSMAKLSGVTSPVLWCERVSPVSAYCSAQAIFGGLAVTQKLHVNISPLYKKNMGFTTTKTRLQYTVPEDAGISSSNLTGIDQIAAEAINGQATPGCVVLVARDGKVIFTKAYGYHTYDKTMPDKLTDLFDLASMTKISATTMETMLLYDQGKLGLDSTVGDYLAVARKTNKNDIKVRELLEHQAGLIPDIPTVEAVKPEDKSSDSSAAFPTKVNEGYY